MEVRPGAQVRPVLGTEDGMQVTWNGGTEAFESPDGKTLYYTKGNLSAPGLWSMPVEGGEEAVLPQMSSLQPGFWAVTDRGIYFVDFSGIPVGQPVPVKLFDFQKRQLSQVARTEKIRQSTWVSFTVTRDGRWMAWRQMDRAESNLMLIENFR